MAERYPPDDPREWLNRARSNLLSRQEYEEAVNLAEEVIRWAEERLQ